MVDATGQKKMFNFSIKCTFSLVSTDMKLNERKKHATSIWQDTVHFNLFSFFFSIFHKSKPVFFRSKLTHFISELTFVPVVGDRKKLKF